MKKLLFLVAVTSLLAGCLTDRDRCNDLVWRLSDYCAKHAIDTDQCMVSLKQLITECQKMKD